MTDIDDGSEPMGNPGEGGAAVPRLSLVDRFQASVGGEATRADLDQRLLPDRLCRAVVDVLGVDGAAISVYLGADVAVPVGASDLDAAMGEALQFTVREGPCFEAYSTRRPVLVPDIGDEHSLAWSRWPTYTAELTRRTSYRAVFAYPLLAGDLAMGSLSLYAGTHPGSRGSGGSGEVGGIAARVAELLLEAEIFTDADADGEPEHRWMNGPSGRRRRRVWVAQGLTAQANRLTPGQAIDLLRAQAFSRDRLLDDLADDIVSGRLPVPVLRSDR